MIYVVTVVLIVAVIAFGALWSAMRIGATLDPWCGAGCGARIEPFAGVRDGSGSVCCSGRCADDLIRVGEV